MGRTACTEPQCLYKGALYLYLSMLQARLLLGLQLGMKKPEVGRTEPTWHDGLTHSSRYWVKQTDLCTLIGLNLMSRKYSCSLQRTITVWRALHRLLLTQKHRTTKITCTVLISIYCITGTKNISTNTQWQWRLQQLHLPHVTDRQTDRQEQLFVPEKVLIQIRHSLYEFHKQCSKEQCLLTPSPNHRLSTKQDTKDSCRCTP
jgi:hypothetical protein